MPETETDFCRSIRQVYGRFSMLLWKIIRKDLVCLEDQKRHVFSVTGHIFSMSLRKETLILTSCCLLTAATHTYAPA